MQAGTSACRQSCTGYCLGFNRVIDVKKIHQPVKMEINNTGEKTS
jgi:hypothetical protein